MSVAGGGVAEMCGKISHERGGGALPERGERRRQGDPSRGADADLRFAAELGHGEPSVPELSKPDGDVEVQLGRRQPEVRADEPRMLFHAWDRHRRS
jgi:hypothetical protein